MADGGLGEENLTGEGVERNPFGDMAVDIGGDGVEAKVMGRLYGGWRPSMRR